MKVTANQLTALRIILIPIPCGLLLANSHVLNIVALILYVVIGITDFFDGILARKYGTTPLGGLLDPIADKIYVALLFIPMALVGYIPAWAVVLILLRDPLITKLRSLSNMRGISMKTASFAQYKTAIEMVTGCFILWVCVVRGKASAVGGMGVIVFLSLLWMVLYTSIKKKFDLKLVTLVVMVTGALVVRLFFGPDRTSYIFCFATLLVVWGSGLHYLYLFFRNYSKGSQRISPAWWLETLSGSLIFPLIVLVMQFMGEIPPWVPMMIFCLEFVHGAIENILTSRSMKFKLSFLFWKICFQLICSVIIFVKIYRAELLPSFLLHEVFIDSYLLLGITVLSAVFLFFSEGIKLVGSD